MPTLTSTGAVNLSSATNWSPSQIPALGDDLIIAGHTLTADIDFTANTITFNNAASRLAISGTPRTLAATNGFFVTGNIAATLVSTAITAGNSLTLAGKWTLNVVSGSASFALISMSGGSATLRTISGVATDVLIETINSPSYTIGAISGGSLTTVGLFNCAASAVATMITLTNAATWSHSSSGINVLTAGNPLISIAGSAVVNWAGNARVTATTFVQIQNSWSGTVNWTGSIFHESTGSIYGINFAVSGQINHIGDLSTATMGTVASVNTGIFNWASQSVTLGAGREIRINAAGGTCNLAGLNLNNSGRLAVIRTAGSIVTSQTTQVTNGVDAQAVCIGSNAFDGKILQLTTLSPTLPSSQNVAAGTVYGYTGFTLTGTGLILDPAILASAIGTSSPTIAQGVWRRLRSADDGQAGSYGAVNEWAGAVDLVPVLNRLPDALENGRIKAVATVSTAGLATEATQLAILAQTSLIGQGGVSIQSPVNQTGELQTLIVGDAYQLAANRAITINVLQVAAGLQTILSNGATVHLGFRSFGKSRQSPDFRRYEFAGTIVSVAATTVVRFELTTNQTKGILPGQYDYDIEFRQGGNYVTSVSNAEDVPMSWRESSTTLPA